MTNAKLSILVKICIVALAVCGIVMCAAWYPFSISLSVMGPVVAPPTVAQNVEMWVQLVFYWVVSLPCFAVLVIAWKLTGAIKFDEIFTFGVARLLKHAMLLLCADIAAFVVGNIVFACLGWNDYAIVYFFIAVIGLVVACIFLVLSHYVSVAAELREQTEGMI